MDLFNLKKLASAYLEIRRAIEARAPASVHYSCSECGHHGAGKNVDLTLPPTAQTLDHEIAEFTARKIEQMTGQPLVMTPARPVSYPSTADLDQRDRCLNSTPRYPEPEFSI